jgi:hypothetical protein
VRKFSRGEIFHARGSALTPNLPNSRIKRFLGGFEKCLLESRSGAQKSATPQTLMDS